MPLLIKPPNYKFCPFCGRAVKKKKELGHLRKFCPDCRWTYYPHVAGAAAAIIIKNNQVLMVKRKIRPYKDTWMFPAGFIDYGEHPQEAVVREVKEETGLKVKKVNLLEVIQSEDDPLFLTIDR